jgi:hypothetical protein
MQSSSNFSFDQNYYRKKLCMISSSHGGEYKDGSLIALMMEAIWSSEMPVNLKQSTWCHNPEESHLSKKLIYHAIYI